MSNEKYSYWVIYDFSYHNSYGEFYQWIAETDSNAKECCINGVFFKFTGNINDLEESLNKALTNAKKERIYVVYKNEKGITSGKFLFGKRKRSTPWDDYIMFDEESVDY